MTFRGINLDYFFGIYVFFGMYFTNKKGFGIYDFFGMY